MSSRSDHGLDAPGAELRVEIKDGIMIVTFPQAHGRPEDPVFLYRVSAVGADGETIASVYTVHEYWNACGPAFYTAELPLPADAVFVEVTAENAYGRKSAPLRAPVRKE